MKKKRYISMMVMLVTVFNLAACGNAKSVSESAEITEGTHLTQTQEQFQVELAVVEPETLEETVILEESYDETFLAEENLEQEQIPELYVSLIQKYYEQLQTQDIATTDAPIGVIENGSRMSVEARLHTFGFALEDLNRDKTPELLISDGDSILAIYTILNDMVVMIAEGWERNQYHLLEDNTLLRLAYSDELCSIMGLYQLGKDGLGLEVKEYYFTEDASIEIEGAEWYGNDIGESDRAISKLSFEGEKEDEIWRQELLSEEKDLEFYSFDVF